MAVSDPVSIRIDFKFNGAAIAVPGMSAFFLFHLFHLSERSIFYLMGAPNALFLPA